MGTIIKNRSWLQRRKLIDFIKQNAFLYIKDLTAVSSGFFTDSSKFGKKVQAATTSVTNDSLIMPASDAKIIAGVTAAGMYSIFYTNDATPNTVLISSIVSNFNILKDGNTLIIFNPDSSFLNSIEDVSLYLKNL